MVAARGSMAHGYYENYEPITDFRRADIFSKAGLRTPAFSGSPTVAGNRGSGTWRGFAVKLYTREGNWDLVG
jgi:catalase